LPTPLPAGRYQLVAGLYEAETGARLPLANGMGDFVPLLTLSLP
jgi:hypothetical protein